MCGVVDLNPTSSAIIGAEDAAYTAYLAARVQGWISLAGSGFAKAYGIGLLDVGELCKSCAAIGRMPQTVNATGGAAAGKPDIA